MGVVHYDEKGIDHIGVYVGAVEFDEISYYNAVVSSTSYGKPVSIKELDPGYWDAGYVFPYVDYSK